MVNSLESGSNTAVVESEKSKNASDRNEDGDKLMPSTRDGETTPLSLEAAEALSKAVPKDVQARGRNAADASNNFPEVDQVASGRNPISRFAPAMPESAGDKAPELKITNMTLAPVEAVNGRFPSSRELPPADYKGPVFEISQDFPQALPPKENLPWLKYDFKTQMPEYMQAVLDYIMEGNPEVNFAGQQNEARKWFHAPWLHYGTSGREFINGLTMERNSRPGELSYSQTKQYQNWGIGMYNPAGAYTLGQVWKNPDQPNTTNISFPEGAVSFKLLYTEAPVKEVPHLQGAPELNANIYTESASPMPEGMPKVIKPVRLVQIDVAIKDNRATETGWVLGTFVYNNKVQHENPYRRVQPVGVAWGSDPDITRARLFLGEKLQQQTLNKSPDLPPQHLGWAGRLNGPVDNPISSCISCHSRAEWPASNVMPPKTTEYDSKEFMKWFTNVKGGTAYTPGSDSLDYSLQLTEGVKHFYEWKAKQGVKKTP